MNPTTERADTLVHDLERLARFEREAKTLAALNHPNIAHIYGFEDSTGVPALVMELVEGPTLADRIARGCIPIDEALSIAKQIAEALEAAHEQAIIHRDLKPANIKVRDDGTVKLLDFGLAKALDTTTASSPSVTRSPTITTPAMMTGVGMILGTAAYMSPEQAKGRAVDRRTDVWAFGCVLFEMVTGKTAFAGDSLAETMAGILDREANWTLLPPATPLQVRNLLVRCLEKDSRRRLQHIGEARIALEEPADTSRTAIVGNLFASRRLPWIAAALGALALASALALILRRSEPAPAVIRMNVSPPKDTTFPGAFPVNGPATPMYGVSPNGQFLVMTAVGKNGITSLWLRSLDRIDAQALPETNGVTIPFWSPDGRQVAFFTMDGKLKRIDVQTGHVQKICDVVAGEGGTWNANGDILFSSGRGSAIMRVKDSAGEPAAVTRLDSQRRESEHSWPQFLPDGKHFLFTAISVDRENSGIYIGSLDGTAPHRIVRSDLNASFARGFLFFVADVVTVSTGGPGTLVAQKLDLQRYALIGEAVRIADNLQTNTRAGRAGFSVNESGTLLYRQTQSRAGAPIGWRDRNGKDIGSLDPQDASYRGYDVSPDGKRVIVHIHDDQTNKGGLWIYDIALKTKTRFTLTDTHDWVPIWSPAGDRVVYASTGTGNVSDLYLKSSNGSDTAQVLLKTPDNKQPVDWSRDGKSILYEVTTAATKTDLYVIPLEGNNRSPQPFLNTAATERKGRFSADGRWIAYMSDETGRDEVYIQPFPPTGGKWQISTNGGSDPQWREGGKELFYVSAARTLTAVPIQWNPTPAAGAAQELFQFDPVSAGIHSANKYWVSPDGKRFLLTTLQSQAEQPLIAVMNWPQLVKK